MKKNNQRSKSFVELKLQTATAQRQAAEAKDKAHQAKLRFKSARRSFKHAKKSARKLAKAALQCEKALKQWLKKHKNPKKKLSKSPNPGDAKQISKITRGKRAKKRTITPVSPPTPSLVA